MCNSERPISGHSASSYLWNWPQCDPYLAIQTPRAANAGADLQRTLGDFRQKMWQVQQQGIVVRSQHEYARSEITPAPHWHPVPPVSVHALMPLAYCNSP